MVRYLVEEGLLEKASGRGARAGDTPLAMTIPEGLRDVIGRRLSWLSLECNWLLSVASVIGLDFGLDALHAVVGLSEEEVVTGLDEVVRVGVLEDQSRGTAVRYRFAHAFFRQTLYEELSTPRRIRLHQQVARALESQYGSRLDEHASELAEHFAYFTEAAGLVKAVEYGEMAAQRSAGVYAYGEAAGALEKALECSRC